MKQKLPVLLSIVTASIFLVLSILPIQAEEKTMIEKPFSTDHLTDLQKKVTMEGGTEKPFQNEYWDNEEEGIYVDIVNGDPLFSSIDKFKSGTGWPSFTQPIQDVAVVEKMDNSFSMERTEIKSNTTDSHLGHVFSDGPAAKGGLRYCINSASLRFIPKDHLEKEGYGDYLKLWDIPQ